MSVGPSTKKQATKILVVEDSPTQLAKLQFLLEESGFQVVTASNGKDGLAAAKSYKIDLVISDIMMPEVDGYAFCKAVRENKELRDVPVILLTSLSDPRDVIQGLEAGANNFICKPFEDHALLARIHNVLANQELRRTASSEMGIHVYFAGQPFFITADRLQILDLLLSTYENAVVHNAELARTRDELRVLNESLEERVAERTAALTLEIAERQKAETLLRDSERRQRLLLQNLPTGVLLLGPDAQTTSSNAKACALLGVTHEELQGTLLGKETWRFLREDGTQLPFEEYPVNVVLRTRQPMTPIMLGIGSSTTPNQTWVLASAYPEFDDDGRIANVIVTLSDVTARVRAEQARAKLEEQLRASQKMEAIGSLAGGIAHDFNNLLSVILNYNAFAMQDMLDGDPVKDDLLEVKHAATRAAALTKQLLAFGRKQMLQSEPLDLNDIATSMEKMLRRILGEDIDLLQNLAPELGLTPADPSQIEQVFMNLVANAHDAMPRGGKLTIETANVEVDEDTVAHHRSLLPGPYVQLSISDTGSGIDEETRARIFEPFFTTKEKGKGTGLGLATVYGIVKQSGGGIWVYSEVGAGTTFKIYLPRLLEATASIRTAPKVLSRVSGTETVLVVEDEEAVRIAAKRILDRAGYKVLTAANGAEALQACEQHQGALHLLLTDVVMPQMSGRVLAERLGKLRPGIKVLYMSGYTDDAIIHHGVLDPGTMFIGKPFNAAELPLKVREVLDSDAAIEDIGAALVTGTQRRPLTKDALSSLPKQVLAELRAAVTAARYDEIVEILGRIRITEPAVASELQRLADSFNNDTILELLGR